MLQYTESLEQALNENHIEVIKHFLRKNADINHYHEGSCTALYSAVIQGQNDVVEFLLENGADVNLGGDNDEFIPLIGACEQRQLDIVKMLIRNGACVNKIKNKNKFALNAAVFNKQLDIVEYLLQNNAEPNETGGNETPLSLACKIVGSEKIVQSLIDYGANVNDSSVNGSYPICLAILKGNEKTIELLIKSGANLQLTDKVGNTPLHIACLSMSTSYQIVDMLLNANADVNALNEEGESALSVLLPSRKKYFEELKLLLKFGSDINTLDRYGYSPLLRVTEYCPFDMQDIVEYLIENKADVNLCTKLGNNALHNVAKDDNVETARYLLQHGVSMSSNNNGELPIHISIESLEMTKLFVEFDNTLVDSPDARGNTPLHLCIMKYQKTPTKQKQQSLYEVIIYLVDKKYNKDLENSDNKTASNLASDYGLTHLTDLLASDKSRKWSVEMATQTSVQETVSRQTSVSVTPRNNGGKWDVMLSYQWSTQAKVLLIKEYLEESGLQVWMDLDRMQGGMNDRMAEAVAYSKVIVLCLSDKYSKSRNCQKEYKYADQLAREIVPVKVESGFHPKVGTALSIIVSDNIWYDLDAAFERDIKKFVKAVKNKIKTL